MLVGNTGPILAENKGGVSEAPLSVRFALAGLGLMVLAAGCLVYLVDRPAESVPFFRLVSLAHLTPTIFGSVGQSLPTFSHVFAFSLLTAACFGLRRNAALAACLGWCLIDLAFEIGQHDAVASRLSEWMLESRFGFLASANGYFESGTFDLVDLVSIVAGAAIAFIVTRRAGSRSLTP